jgi:hypothetical protein
MWERIIILTTALNPWFAVVTNCPILKIKPIIFDHIVVLLIDLV